MGEITLAVAASHAPGLIGLFDPAPEESKQVVTKAYGALETQIREADLDVLIMIGNDHLANNRIREYPDFLIGLAPEHTGPFEFFKDWLACDEYTVPGDPATATKVFNGLIRRGIRTSARRTNLNFDDNISVPVVRSGIQAAGVPIIPILQNCTVPPVPDPRRCYEVGVALRDIITNDLPAGMKVGLYATGGLSHEPGGLRDFWIDEDFDRWFLELLAEGDHRRILDEVTPKKFDEAGIGGTAELLSWIVVLGAAGHKDCEVLGYTAWDMWRCGIGAVRWDMAGEPAGAGRI